MGAPIAPERFPPAAVALDEAVALGDQPQTWGDLLVAAGAMEALVRRTRTRKVLVACADRYHVAAALLGTWSAGGVVILPSNGRSETLAALAAAEAVDLVLSDDGESGTGIRPLLQPPGGGGARRPEAPVSAPPGQHVLTVYTSGSTGRPAACRKTTEQLLGEAALLARVFGLGRGARVLATAPAHHLYGLLFGVLAPLVGGGSFVRTTSPSPGALAEAARRSNANVLCGVPAHFSGLSGLRPDELFSIERAYCSGGRLDSATRDLVCGRFSFPLVEIFGSSETGGIAFREARAAGPWQPFEGVRVAADEQGQLLVDSPFLPPSGPRPFPCADRIRLDADGRFHHEGRTDDVVKIGGERVSTAEVEDKLRALPGVTDAVVVKVSTDGPRQWELWAALVAPGLDQASVRRSLSAVLEPVAIPRRFQFVDALPREHSGKLAREHVLALFGQRLGGEHPAVAPAGRAPG